MVLRDSDVISHSFMVTSVNESSGIGNKAYYQQYYSDREPEFYSWLLSDVLRYGPPGRILDLGCGTGFFVEIGWKWGLDIVGCDGSEDAIKLAHSRNPNLNLSHCILSNKLPFKDSTVSNIVLNQVIEHLPMPVLSNVLSECRRILIPAGMLFIHSPNKANSQEVLKDPTHINPLYPSELRNQLCATGFEIVVEPNSARLPTRNPALSALIRKLMRTSLRDRLSATTNAYARKI